MAKRSLEIKREYEGLEEDETEDEVGESENDDETVDYRGGGGVEEVKEEEEEEEEEEEVEERTKRVLLRMVSRQRGEVPRNTLCCQVDDCGVDLRAAKRYHRRHKVCERHAKAVFVFVDGSEQRFCQQCSRFHEICQFDEAKRSCRKRLAGHNQRRRKNQPEPPTEGRRGPPIKAAEHSDYDEISFRGNGNTRHFRIR